MALLFDESDRDLMQGEFDEFKSDNLYISKYLACVIDECMEEFIEVRHLKRP